MKILIIGGGGREHALAWKIKQSPRVSKIFCAPGNPGIGKIATCIPIRAGDIAGLLSLAVREKIDLTIVGPEAPLVNGITNEFERNGLLIFGPSKEAARIEGSKAWCHKLMKKYDIPCPRSQTVTDLDGAKKASEAFGIPVVVKASGLAAGKGSIVCLKKEDLDVALKKLFIDREFGEACDEVVFEEFLEGEEASCLALTDGTNFVTLAGSQDHKPAYDGDKGPNTGGMGAYAPAPVLDSAMQERVDREILRPVITAMANEGIPYEGVLYAGLMITKNGPKVIEFNCRFGDPETQVVLPLLKDDLVELIGDIFSGDLARHKLVFSNEAAVCVVLASGGYPGLYEKGKIITGLDNLPPDVIAFHAGTSQKDDKIATSGGRVLGITAKGNDIKEAIEKVYSAIPQLKFEKMFYRKDIGAKALARLS